MAANEGDIIEDNSEGELVEELETGQRYEWKMRCRTCRRPTKFHPKPSGPNCTLPLLNQQEMEE